MNENSGRPKAFVIMPFDEEFNDVYIKFITVALNEAEYEVFRADDLQTQHSRSILQDIVSSITSCDIIVADLTGANANVFYELGLTHGLRRPTILLTQSIEDIPFDLRPYRVISYDVHFAKIEEGKAKLVKLAKGALNGEVLFGSPVTDFESSKAGVLIIDQKKELEKVDDELEKEAVDERGFLDHVVDLENGFISLNEILKEIGSATNENSDEMKEATEKIQPAITKPSSGTASYIRKVSRDLAGKLLRYTDKLKEANDKYYNIAHNTDNSMEFIVSFQEPTTEDDINGLKEFLSMLNKLEEASSNSKESFENTANIIKSHKKLEKHLDRAMRLTADEIIRLVENIERTIASVKRAREIGLKKLYEYNKKSELE